MALEQSQGIDVRSTGFTHGAQQTPSQLQVVLALSALWQDHRDSGQGIADLLHGARRKVPAVIAQVHAVEGSGVRLGWLGELVGDDPGLHLLQRVALAGFMHDLGSPGGGAGRTHVAGARQAHDAAGVLAGWVGAAVVNQCGLDRRPTLRIHIRVQYPIQVR